MSWNLQIPDEVCVEQYCGETVKGGWEAVWLSGLESSSCVTDKKASEGSPAMCDKGGYTSSDKEGPAAPLPDLTHTPAQGPPLSIELHTRTQTLTAYDLSEATRK